jgi:methyltransferase domain protein
LSFLLNVITAWHIKPNTREKQPPPNSDAPHPAPDIVIKPPTKKIPFWKEKIHNSQDGNNQKLWRVTMEYSKEDLMEAKRQILGVGENMGTEESKKIWEKNAQFWDDAMGDESNEFHREVVRPKVTELLSPDPSDYILDIACGNGNYSSYLAQRGASVVAFDYSKKMIELAKRRRSQYAKQIEFCVADATNRESLLGLKRNRAFTKAVSNMAIMDITDIEPLFMAVYELLEENGIFVFATQHPCFITLTEKYMTPHSYYDIAIEGQPEEQIYYHRSIQDIFNLCFRAGFVIDGFYEECFKNNKEIPMVMIVRLKKVKRDSLK